MTALERNSDALTLQHRIIKIITCVDDDARGAITGITTVVGDGNNRKDFALNQYGSSRGICSAYIMPNGALVKNAEIGYDGSRIISLSFTTSTGDNIKIGDNQNTLKVEKYSFSDEHPFIGFYGSSSN